MTRSNKLIIKLISIIHIMVFFAAFFSPTQVSAEEVLETPEITITSPDDNYISVNDSVTVRGTAKNVDKVTVNNVSVDVRSNGSFSSTHVLKNVLNMLTVKAFKDGVEVFSETRTVYYSFTPTIEILNYEPGDVVKKPEVILTGEIKPYNSGDIQSFTINGVSTPVNSEVFTSNPILLKEGVNDIKLVLKTKPYSVPDGRSIPSREITKTFKLEYKPGSEITIYEPDDEEIIYSNQVRVRGKIIDPAGIKKVKIGDKETDVESDGSFSENIVLKSGKNDIKVTFSNGSKTITETITVYSNILAKDGSKMILDAKDGQELKAFNDAIKIKLAKNSIGTNTKAKIEVDNVYLSPIPAQTAIVSPIFHIDWDGDEPIKPYKVTIKYDEVIKDNQAPKVTILFYDDRYAQWKTIGGVVDPKSYSVGVEINHSGYVAAALSYITFGDITNHWAKKDIEFLTAKGAIAGRGTGYSFQPDSSITRAEFVTCLAKAIGLLPYNPLEISYYDVSSSHWAYGYIEAASRAGLISGTSYGSFAPDRTITREEAAAILTRAGNLKAADSQELNSIIGNFKDKGNISAWAKPEVAAAVKAKIITGNEKMQFMPKATTTRAQAVTMIARLYEYINKTK